jgi:hypothetical protein
MKLKCVLRIANMSGGRYRQNRNIKKKKIKGKVEKTKILNGPHRSTGDFRQLGNTERKTSIIVWIKIKKL